MHTKIIHNYDQLVESFRHIKTLMSDKPMELIFRPWKADRSAAQNRLMWQWNTEIAKFSNETGLSGDNIASSKDVHEFLVPELLGIKPVSVMGRTKISRPHTSDFNVKEMTDYLEKMELWCGDVEIPLTQPPDKRYVMYGEKA